MALDIFIGAVCYCMLSSEARALICITFIFIVRMVFVITFGGIDEQNNFVQ
jgi:hypothetical protein